jgi:hypothetical protein
MGSEEETPRAITLGENRVVASIRALPDGSLAAYWLAKSGPGRPAVIGLRVVRGPDAAPVVDLLDGALSHDAVFKHQLLAFVIGGVARSLRVKPDDCDQDERRTELLTFVLRLPR